MSVLAAALNRAREHFAKDAAEATKLLTTGESPRDFKLEPREHAAWTTLCLMILNLDEVLTR
jgi:hypothetical protein